MKKLDMRVQKTYKQLLDTFVLLLMEKSFEELTVSEICERANVHRATFYKHFKDKYEFLSFCFENYLTQIEIKKVENNPTVADIKDTFMNFIIKVLDYIKVNKRVFAIICSDEYAFSLGASFSSAVSSYCYNKIKQIIPGATDERAEIFASFYSGAFISVIKWFATSEPDYPIEDLYDFLEARVDELCETYVKKYI